MTIHPKLSAQPFVTGHSRHQKEYDLSIDIEDHSLFLTKEQAIHTRNKLNTALRKIEAEEFKNHSPLTEDK